MVLKDGIELLASLLVVYLQCCSSVSCELLEEEVVKLYYLVEIVEEISGHDTRGLVF